MAPHRLAEPAAWRPMLTLAAAAVAGYLVLWVTVALAYEQSPIDLRARDAYPFLSGAAVFAAAGMLLGALRARGRPWMAGGALAGAGVGYAAAAWLLANPYVLPFLVPAIAVVGAGSAVGGVVGGLAEIPRRRRRAAVARP